MVRLNEYSSLCEKRQKIIVSNDEGKCNHRAINNNNCSVRQYMIDGNVIKTAVEKCDYLVLNDDTKDAYYIELKGADINKAIRQVENTERLLNDDLKGYNGYYRIIYKSGTHAVNSSHVNKWKEKKGRQSKGNKPIAVVKNMQYEEMI